MKLYGISLFSPGIIFRSLCRQWLSVILDHVKNSTPPSPWSAILYTKEFSVKNSQPRIWDPELQLLKNSPVQTARIHRMQINVQVANQPYDCYNLMCCELVFWKCLLFSCFNPDARTARTHINRDLFVEIHLNLLPGYLDEFMWREREGGRERGREGQDKFEAILYEISRQYPV